MKPFHVVAETHDLVTDVSPSIPGPPATLLSHSPHRIVGSGGASVFGAGVPADTCNAVIPSSSKTFIIISQMSSQLYAGVYDKSFIIEDISMIYAYLLEFAERTFVITMLTPCPAGHVPHAIPDA
jgi:hypothetical protein